MPITTYNAGQRVTAAALNADLQSAYRDELLCPGKAETCPRWAVNNSATIVSGKLNLMAVYLVAGQVISNFSWDNGSTAGVALTHQWAGLYSNAFAQLAVTSDKTTTAIPAATAFTWAVATTGAGVASTYTATYSGLYYVGLMIAATTTMPTPCASGGAIQSPANAHAPAFGGSDTGQTTVPAFPHTAATPSAGQTPYIYMYLT